MRRVDYHDIGGTNIRKHAIQRQFLSLASARGLGLWVTLGFLVLICHFLSRHPILTTMFEILPKEIQSPQNHEKRYHRYQKIQ